MANASYVRLIANVERLSSLLGKAGFRSDQPRVPRGNPDGGQWTDEGGGEEGWLAALQRRVPEPLVLASDNPQGPPEVPEDPPPTTQVRNQIAVAVAKFLYMSSAKKEYDLALWLYDHANDRIVAYLEQPKTLDELYALGLEPKAGYDRHHIVMKTPARKAGHSDKEIDSPENIVLIPTYRHWQITAWFNTRNELFNWQTPEEYLRSKPWHVKRQIGLRALRQHGVLK